MSLIASGVALRHRLATQRDANAGEETNSRGDIVKPGWDDHLDEVPCRAWTTTVQEPNEDDVLIAVEERRVAVKRGTDITEADRVLEVTEKDGTVLFDGPMEVKGVQIYPDHIELQLKRIR